VFLPNEHINAYNKHKGATVKKLICGIKVFVLCGVSLLFGACVDIDAITIKNPDLRQVANGTYRGESKVGPVRVALDVTVENGTYQSIQIIRHFNGRGKSAEAIIPTIISAQSLEVDVISGATGSSKAILKAVEDALK
jgi:uncharacterized protein with FMN-binding domain